MIIGMFVLRCYSETRFLDGFVAEGVTGPPGIGWRGACRRWLAFLPHP